MSDFKKVLDDLKKAGYYKHCYELGDRLHDIFDQRGEEVEYFRLVRLISRVNAYMHGNFSWSDIEKAIGDDVFMLVAAFVVLRVLSLDITFLNISQKE